MPVSLRVYCEAKVHCKTCRNTSAEGQAWRESLHQHLKPSPAGGVDWECPYGYAWQSSPPGAPPPTAEELAARELERSEALARRRDRATWPMFARWLAKASALGDKGLGDTAQRLAAKLGGEAIKSIYKKVMGSDCGCGDRQERMNAEFPY